jgi:hypothetical protein
MSDEPDPEEALVREQSLWSLRFGDPAMGRTFTAARGL